MCHSRERRWSVLKTLLRNKKYDKRFDKQTKRGKMINPFHRHRSFHIEWNSIVSSWRGTINTRYAPLVATSCTRNFLAESGNPRGNDRAKFKRFALKRALASHLDSNCERVKEANHAESRRGYKDVSRARFVSMVSRELYANWMVRNGAPPRIVFVRPGFCGRREGRKKKSGREKRSWRLEQRRQNNGR